MLTTRVLFSLKYVIEMYKELIRLGSDEHFKYLNCQMVMHPFVFNKFTKYIKLIKLPELNICTELINIKQILDYKDETFA